MQTCAKARPWARQSLRTPYEELGLGLDNLSHGLANSRLALVLCLCLSTCGKLDSSVDSSRLCANLGLVN